MLATMLVPVLYAVPAQAQQRHRRAGQLENRDQRWYLPS
jgi:hypothetical protein